MQPISSEISLIVSVVIPVYNEEATILHILEKVREQIIDGVTFQIIVIDDGSRDQSVQLLKQRVDLYDCLVVHERNMGKGAAIISGLSEATGEFVLFQDADLEYDPQDYAKLLEPVRRFDADIVMGSRLVASPITRVSYFWHKIGNRLITFLFNLFNNTTFTDVYSCYLLYRRPLVRPAELRTLGWEQQAEILSHAVRRARKIFEVPISYYGRSYDEGKKIRAHHAVTVIWTILYERVFRRIAV